MRKKVLSVLLCIALIGTTAAGCSSKGSENKTTNPEANALKEDNGETGDKKKETELTLLIGSGASTDGIEAVCKAAKEKLGINIEIEKVSGGEDLDNIVKTRLASGDMSDIIAYNTGSLLGTLNPAEYFYDLSNEAFASTFDDTFKEAASVDNKLYGIPQGSTQCGAVLYNKEMYEKYDLKVPKTWDEFLANCDVLKNAGETAVIGSFGDAWTTQVPFLGDQYNVNAVNSHFAEDFEAGKVKYATDAGGIRSFEKMKDLTPYYNSDYLATSYDDGCEMLAEGKGAQWFMLTSALGNIYSLYGDDVNKIGVFAIPGDDPEKNGITVWQSHGFYINKNSEKVQDVLKFFEFYVSKEGMDIYNEAQLPDGPYAIKGYQLPQNCYQAVKDMQANYYDTGNTALALEFQTSVKGANCASICQELGSGQTTAAEAASKYDQDCEKQAKQLGLDW